MLQELKELGDSLLVWAGALISAVVYAIRMEGKVNANSTRIANVERDTKDLPQRLERMSVTLEFTADAVKEIKAMLDERKSERDLDRSEH